MQAGRGQAAAQGEEEQGEKGCVGLQEDAGDPCSPVWPLAQQSPHREAGAQHCSQGRLQQHPPQHGGTPLAAADLAGVGSCTSS